MGWNEHDQVLTEWSRQIWNPAGIDAEDQKRQVFAALEKFETMRAARTSPLELCYPVELRYWEGFGWCLLLWMPRDEAKQREMKAAWDLHIWPSPIRESA